MKKMRLKVYLLTSKRVSKDDAITVSVNYNYNHACNNYQKSLQHTYYSQFYLVFPIRKFTAVNISCSLKGSAKIETCKK